jgi:hypothetical protein
MKTLTEYQLPQRTRSEQLPLNLVSSQHTRNKRRSTWHMSPRYKLPRERSELREVEGAVAASPLYKSRLLRTEETMLRFDLSKRQMDSAVVAAERTFKTVYPTASEEVEHAKQWKDAMNLFSEHQELLEVVKCKQYQKRDNVARAEIASRHPEVSEDIREGYLKIMRRLHAFQKKTALQFPPNCGVFFRW